VKVSSQENHDSLSHRYSSIHTVLFIIYTPSSWSATGCELKCITSMPVEDLEIISKCIPRGPRYKYVQLLIESCSYLTDSDNFKLNIQYYLKDHSGTIPRIPDAFSKGCRYNNVHSDSWKFDSIWSITFNSITWRIILGSSLDHLTGTISQLELGLRIPSVLLVAAELLVQYTSSAIVSFGGVFMILVESILVA
jgi:hypothetical protein